MRRINKGILGSNADLAGFLFGGEREDLTKQRAILREIQEGTCFYCEERLRSRGDVDHFVPWALHPANLGHNLVLAHSSCNGRKSDRLAAIPHLARWCARNAEHGPVLTAEFDREGVLHDLGATRRIATWAYERVEAVGGRVWLRDRTSLEPLDTSWRSVLDWPA